MIRIVSWFLLCLAGVLLLGCGGGSGGESANTDTGALRGVWTATLDTRAQTEVVAELTVQQGAITGFLRLSDGSQDLTGAVTGTQQGQNVQFSAQLGESRFTFEGNTPLAVGSELVGSCTLGAEGRRQIRFHHDGNDSHDVGGAWAGEWTSTMHDRLQGTWSAEITQDGHRLQGHGKVLLGEHEYALTVSGSIVGRFVALAAAVGGERASLWRGAVTRTETGFTLTGRYIGRMVPGDGADEGNLNGGLGGHHGEINIRPREAILPPGTVETFHSSQPNVEWSQRSDEAQPGEFFEPTDTSVRFKAPLIGGRIQIKATSKRDPSLFGTAHVMVTGAAGVIGGQRFHTTAGVAARVGADGARTFVVEIGMEEGGLRLQAPASVEPARFHLAPEVATIGFRTPRGAAFRANGDNRTPGVIAYTRVSENRLSGRFEAVLRHVEHPEETITVEAVFDVPFARPHH